MSINSEMVMRLEELARLRLSRKEREAMAADLSRMLVFLDGITRLDCDDHEELDHKAKICNVFRPDQAEESWSRDQMLANAPQSRDGYFQVPPALESGGDS